MIDFRYKILAILWPSYIKGPNPYRFLKVLKHWVIQKIFRFNAHVSWPVHYSSTIYNPEKIQRGDMCPGLSRGNHIDGRNGIVFGKNVWIGPYVAIISQNHDTQCYEEYIVAEPIKISENCWLGTHSVILPGVELGPHTIVAAGAVVTKSFPLGDQVLGGNPARIIKRLPSYRSKQN